MASQSRTPTGRTPKSQPQSNSRSTRPAGPQSAASRPGLASAVQRATAAGAGSLRPADVITLQRSVGNRAASGVASRRSRPAALPIQAKLNVGPADDSFEREADRVAGQVTRMPAPAAPSATGRPAAAAQGEPTPVRRAPAASLDEDADLQTDREGAEAGFEAGPEFEGRLQRSHGAGAPLPDTLRREMEPKFGADFSGVRVHTGTESAVLNRQVQARAFTHGPDIHFASGQYNPASTAGKSLLAHELTHTVQQGAAPASASVQRAAAPAIQREYEATDDPDEAEVAEDPAYDRPGRLVTKNTSLYAEAGKRKKVSGASKLKANDFVAIRGTETVESTSWGKKKSRVWHKVQVIQQGGKDVQNSNIEGYVKADHLKLFYTHQQQTGVPLLTPGKLPNPKDVKQGAIGDCYLMAAMMTLAANKPRAIVEMFKPSIYDASASDVAVRFFEVVRDTRTNSLAEPGAPKWVKVKKSVVVAGGDYERAQFKKGDKVLAKGRELWPSIIEKAFAVYKGTTYAGLAGAGFILNNITSVMTVIGGEKQRMENTDWGYQMSQGADVEGESREQREARYKRKTAERVIAILSRGGTMFTGTGDSTTPRQTQQYTEMGLVGSGTGSAGEAKTGGLAGGHAYEVVGLKKSGGKLYVKIRNPWGEYGRTKYDETDKFGVQEGEQGAVSWVEINDFLDAFKKLHHSLTEEEVTQAKEALEDTDLLDTLEV